MLADENLLLARVMVLANARAVPRLERRVDVLQPLTLPNRIEDEHDVALPGEPLAKRLVAADRFAREGVTALAHHARQRKRAAFRHIEIRRHQKTGTALEDHVLDVIGVALDPAGDAGVERSFFRPRPHALLDA